MSKPVQKEDVADSVMGNLRYVEERTNRKRIANYKKRFFVLNARQRSLDMYKNDQTPIPLQQIAASDMRSVVYSGDKQNRFYMMTLQMRMGVSLKFRMNSFEERETWFNAVNTLIEKSATHNRRLNIDSLIKRKLQAASDYLKVDITLGHYTFLTEVEENLLQFVPEAVLLMVGTITELVRMYEGELRRPKHYMIMVYDAKEGGETKLSPPRYDPARATVVLYVLISRDPLGRVQFSGNKAVDVDKILTSEIFRNPLIEGWIDNEPGCRDICDEMQRLLSTPQRRATLSVTFEWELYVENSDKVKQYLRTFVGIEFFRRRLDALRRAIQDVATLIEDVQTAAAGLQYARAGSFVSPLPSPHNVGGGGGSGGGGSGLRGMRPSHSRSHSATSTIGGLAQPNLVMTGTNAVPAPGSPADIHSSAVRLLAENITGLPIRLDARRVEECKEPPLDIVTCSPMYDIVCRPAILLLGGARELLMRDDSRGSSGTASELREELYDIGFHALVAQKLGALNTRLRTLFHKKVRVKIDWQSLFSIFKRQRVRLEAKDVVHTVEIFADMYVSRLEHMVHFLGRAESYYAGGADPSPAGDRPYDIFLACVRCILVTFRSYEAQPISLLSAANALEPVIQNGILTDTMYCADETNMQLFLNAAFMSNSMFALGNTFSGQSLRRAIPLVQGMSTIAAAPRLGRWVEEYFAVPDKYRPVPQASIALDDGFYSDNEDSGSDEEAQLGERKGIDRADLDDAVAYERSAEIRVLNSRGVVNKVYDSQGSALGLMISALDIRQAIRAFQSAFPHQTVSKHNMMHTLIFNLHRLRALYVRVADSEDVTALTEEEATQLLREFCEYAENEKLIAPALKQYARRPSVVESTPSDGSAETAATVQELHTTDVPKVDFVLVSRVALNHLLPAEALVARRAQRVGFICGLKNTGKTLLINSMRGIARPTAATVGLSRQMVCFEQWVLAMHELGGSDSFSNNWRFYAKRLEAVHFLIFVVDYQDRPSFPVVQAYLERLTEFFVKPIPLVVVFNNFRELPRAVFTEELEGSIGIDKLRKQRHNAKRSIFTCRCNVSVVSAENKEMPETLRYVMQLVSAELLADTPAAKRPSMPKAVSPVEPSLAAVGTRSSVASPVRQSPNKNLIRVDTGDRLFDAPVPSAAGPAVELRHGEGEETKAFGPLSLETGSEQEDFRASRGERPLSQRSATDCVAERFMQQVALSTTRDDTPRSLDDTYIPPSTTAATPYTVNVRSESTEDSRPAGSETPETRKSSQLPPYRDTTQLPPPAAHKTDKPLTDCASEDVAVDVGAPAKRLVFHHRPQRLQGRQGESFRSPSISDRAEQIIYVKPPASRSKTRQYGDGSHDRRSAETPPPPPLSMATCRTATPLPSRTEASLEVHEPFGRGGDAQSDLGSPQDSVTGRRRKMTLQPEESDEQRVQLKKRR